jgi:hypothetical protein
MNLRIPADLEVTPSIWKQWTSVAPGFITTGDFGTIGWMDKEQIARYFYAVS